MDPISLVSGGLGILSGLAGGIFGAVNASRQAAQANRMQQQRDNFNNALFQRQYYQDALSRSDTQHLLRRLRNDMKKATEAQRNAAVISGATPEALAANKASNARAYADAIASIDATNAQRQDAALAQHQAAQNNSYADWIKNHSAQAANWANFTSQALATGSSSIHTIADAFDKARTQNNGGINPNPTTRQLIHNRYNDFDNNLLT